jgi:diguanylate cyclase (GGDEF)-like protein/PAS domain S-box-containing protein
MANISANTLTRYFSYLALALVMLSGVAIGLTVRQQEIKQLKQLAEERNVAMAKVFRQLLSHDINERLHRPHSLSPTELHSNLDALNPGPQIAALMQDAEVIKLKLYNPQGVTVFSTDPTQIGEDESSNAGFILAKKGKVATELVQRDQFSAFEGVMVDIDLISSYVPILENGRVVAVFEVYQNVSLLMQRIDDSLFQVWAIMAIVLGALYLLLLLVINHAQKELLAQEALLAAVNSEFGQRADAELRVAATAFESQESMLITDANQVILRVNKAFSESSGYSAEELIGQTPKILKSDRHDSGYYAAMWENINRTGYWQGEIWDRRKDGQVYLKWLNISAVKNPHGVVTHYVGTHTDITARKIAEDKIKHLAFFDQLTGLPNRTLLLDRLKQNMATGARSGTYGAVLFLDLDDFKSLNDTLGHDHGDLLLQQVAQRLTANVRQGDTVARLGGDEFVILLDNLEEAPLEAASQVEIVCRKILEAIQQDYLLPRAEVHSSASIGVTLFQGQQNGIEELLKQADLAMYQSKEAGRNAYTFFDPAMEATMLQHAQMEVDLRRALKEEEFLLYYQAQVEGESARVLGVEALIRWNHPTRGMVFPDQFIPDAEESGLIVPIGLWVLKTACAQLANWATQAGMAHLSMAVNVSIQQFREPNFVDQVLEVLEQSGANPHRLKLELTESLFVNNVEDIIAKMTRLKAKGIGFSLDDFGTGYSSLAYLSRLPLDQLKIDRSFVMNLETSETNVAICAATISLAHSLKLKVVAEGVETEAQRYFLTTVHRCSLLQGYLFSRPLSLKAFENFVNNGD